MGGGWGRLANWPTDGPVLAFQLTSDWPRTFCVSGPVFCVFIDITKFPWPRESKKLCSNWPKAVIFLAQSKNLIWKNPGGGGCVSAENQEVIRGAQVP
jgi:hypothetical protein